MGKKVQIDVVDASSTRDWSELPLDALALIFGKVGAIEILMGAGLVCRSWLAAAKLPDLWRSVGMARHKVVVELEEARSWSMEPTINGYMLCAMARVAVDRSGGRLEQFAGKLFVTDELLKYIARTALKVVSLRSCDAVSNEGFAHLVAKCPLLVIIQLSLCQHVGGRDVYESTGMACAQLKRFNLRKAPSFFDTTMDMESSGEALGVAAMHELRRLTLGNSDVTNDELVAILDGCPHLAHLDLRFCPNIVVDEALRARCAGIRSLMLPIQEEEYEEKLSSRDVDGDYWHSD